MAGLKLQFTEQITKDYAKEGRHGGQFRGGPNYPGDEPVVCVNVKLLNFPKMTADKVWKWMQPEEGEYPREVFDKWFAENSGLIGEQFERAVDDSRIGLENHLFDAGIRSEFAGRSGGWVAFTEITQKVWEALSKEQKDVVLAAIGLIEENHVDAVMDTWAWYVSQVFENALENQKTDALELTARSDARRLLRGLLQGTSFEDDQLVDAISRLDSNAEEDGWDWAKEIKE